MFEQGLADSGHREREVHCEQKCQGRNQMWKLIEFTWNVTVCALNGANRVQDYSKSHWRRYWRLGIWTMPTLVLPKAGLGINFLSTGYNWFIVGIGMFWLIGWPFNPLVRTAGDQISVANVVGHLARVSGRGRHSLDSRDWFWVYCNLEPLIWREWSDDRCHLSNKFYYFILASFWYTRQCVDFYGQTNWIAVRFASLAGRLSEQMHQSP